MNFPITLEAFLTVGGIAILAGVIVQVFKREIPDWRWTNLVTLGICLVLAVAGQLIRGGWPPDAEALFTVLLVAFAGASSATYGYEVIQNARGLVGRGERSDPEYLARRARLKGR